MKDLSILIVTRNRVKELRVALQSCLFLTGLRAEVIVIDQMGHEDVKQVCDLYNAKYYHVDTNSLSVARNYGISISAGSWLLFLDDDAQLSSLGAAFLKSRLLTYDEQVICANVKCVEDERRNFYLVTQHCKQVSCRLR